MTCGVLTRAERANRQKAVKTEKYTSNKKLDDLFDYV